MSLYWVILVDSTDRLYHLWKQTEREEPNAIRERGHPLLYFCHHKKPDRDIGSEKMKNILHSFLEFEIVICGAVSSGTLLVPGFIYLSAIIVLIKLYVCD